MSDNQEVEIKLRINRPSAIAKKLKVAGAKDSGSVFQYDILFDYADGSKTFGTYDQALRLRLEAGKGVKRGKIAFKGTPKLDTSGKKTRDEFETEVQKPDALEKILLAIGFKESMRIEKRRTVFELDKVEIAIDEANFGNFLELEGNKEEIDRLIGKLDLTQYPVETKPYFILLREWQQEHCNS